MMVEEKIHFINGIGYWVKNIRIGGEPDKPTLVFLHDALGCTATWKEFPERLCQTLQLNGIVFDRQGHGNSAPFNASRPLNYLEIEAHEALPLLLSHLKIKEKILIGHSDGASIALLYESQFQNTKAIISMAAHVNVEHVTLTGIKEASNSFEEPSIFEKFERYHGDKTMKLINDWSNIWLSDSFRNWNIISQLTSIKCPTLAIQGTEDEYATDEHLFTITTSIGTSASAVLLEDCGHFPYKEKPDEVIGMISQFLM